MLVFRHTITHNIAAIVLLTAVTFIFICALLELIIHMRAQKEDSLEHALREEISATVELMQDGYKKRYMPLDVDLTKHFPDDAPTSGRHQEPPYIGS